MHHLFPLNLNADSMDSLVTIVPKVIKYVADQAYIASNANICAEEHHCHKLGMFLVYVEMVLSKSVTANKILTLKSKSHIELRILVCKHLSRCRLEENVMI